MHVGGDITRRGIAADADQHRGEADEAVQERNQLRHLRHLHFARLVDADGGADEHGDDDVAKAAAVVIVKGGDERDGHADDAVEVAVFRAFLTREAGEREDEEDGGDDVSRCDGSVVHGCALLNYKGKRVRAVPGHMRYGCALYRSARSIQ